MARLDHCRYCERCRRRNALLFQAPLIVAMILLAARLSMPAWSPYLAGADGDATPPVLAEAEPFPAATPGPPVTSPPAKAAKPPAKPKPKPKAKPKPRAKPKPAVTTVRVTKAKPRVRAGRDDGERARPKAKTVKRTVKKRVVVRKAVKPRAVKPRAVVKRPVVRPRPKPKPRPPVTTTPPAIRAPGAAPVGG